MLDKIKKSIEILSSYDNHFNVKFEVFENDFTLRGWSESQTCDELDLDGNCISMENLTDMYFAIEGEFKSLLQIIEAIEYQIQTDAEVYQAGHEQDCIDEERMRKELSSPYLTGRI